MNSVIELKNPYALSIAEALDRERDRMRTSSLPACPVLIKDNIDTADRMNDELAVSLAREGSIAAA